MAGSDRGGMAGTSDADANCTTGRSRDPDRRFDDVFNLVHHPDFLTVAWERVRGNKGARSAGVDRLAPASMTGGCRDGGIPGATFETELKARTFAPLPVREILDSQTGEQQTQAARYPHRRWTARCKRRCCWCWSRSSRRISSRSVTVSVRDVGLRTRSPRYMLWGPGTITGSSRRISRRVSTNWLIPQSWNEVRTRIVDKRVLALIKVFLKAGIMSADGTVRESDTGTPQGGILSPLLANIALTVLDAAFPCKMGCPSDIP